MVMVIVAALVMGWEGGRGNGDGDGVVVTFVMVDGDGDGGTIGTNECLWSAAIPCNCPTL